MWNGCRRRELVLSGLGLLAACLFLPGVTTAETTGKAEASEAKASRQARGYFGASLDYEEVEGLGRYRVSSVTPGGPAESGGLQVGDLIVAVNDVSFKFSTELEQFEAFLWLEPDDVVVFDVLRDGMETAVEVTAGTMDPENQRRWDEVIRSLRISQAINALSSLGAGSGSALRVQRNDEGVLVFSAEGYPAATFRHVEAYLRTMWVSEQALDLLKPGDRFLLRISTQGRRINTHIEDAPDYIEEALGAAMRQAGGGSRQ